MDPWAALAEIEFLLRTAGNPAGAVRGPGWFGAISGMDNAEMNVCGIGPDGTPAAAAEVVAAIGELPVVVFTSEHVGDDVRAVLVDAGCEVSPAPDPLMTSIVRPAPADGPFRIAPAEPDELPAAIRLTGEAHHVPEPMLAASIAVAAERGLAEPWLAWDGDEPVSAVWLVRNGPVLGVTEMMTPARHQRRGAGRQLLTRALAERWTADTETALLVSTPAGRRLYASIGFTVADEVVTAYRGVEDGVLEAIGHPG